MGAKECREEGEQCWMDSECCSSHCAFTARCGVKIGAANRSSQPRPQDANKSAEPLSHEANKSAELLQTNGALAHSSDELKAQEAKECREEGEQCWMDSECCSSHCAFTARCGVEIHGAANRS